MVLADYSAFCGAEEFVRGVRRSGHHVVVVVVVVVVGVRKDRLLTDGRRLDHAGWRGGGPAWGSKG